MGKVRKEKKYRAHAPAPASKRAVALATAAEANVSETVSKEPETVLSRGQRKRQEKRERYNRMLGKLVLTPRTEDVGALGSLAGVSGALPSTTDKSQRHKRAEPGAAIGKVVSNKTRQKVLAQEVSNLQQVHAHPAFQSNPFATIMLHLNNTVPPPSGTNTAPAPRGRGGAKNTSSTATAPTKKKKRRT